MKTIHKKDGGFTLVELIVVIAILAILAAVAIPAYSGYIEKAEKANDLQLLGAVNQAFASACVDQGFTQYDVKNALLPINDYGMLGNNQATMSADPSAPRYIVSLSFKEQGMSVNIDAFNAAFAVYFSGNESTAFKTFENGLIYSPETGFVALEDYEGDVTVSYKGVDFSVSSEVAAQLAGSVYGEMGASTLMGQVGTAVNATNAALLLQLEDGEGVVYDLVNSEEFNEELWGYLGINTDEEWDEFSAGYSEAELAGVMSNALILSAAGNTVTKTEDENTAFLNSLANGTFTATLNSTSDMADMAATYALYVAYNKRVNPEAEVGASLTQLNGALSDTEFQKYVKNYGTEDLAAYTAAMKVINDATTGEGGVDASTDIVTNGFNNDELKSLLAGFIGN